MGLFSGEMGRCFIHYSLLISEFRQKEEGCKDKSWIGIFGAGILFAHPMFVISMRTINSGKYGYETVLDIARKEGAKGFYRGLLPATLIYCVTNYV